MASAYPGALDNFPARSGDSARLVGPDVDNDYRDAINKMQTEQGVNPSGSFTDVVTRLGKHLTVAKTGDQTNATTTFANVTDLVFPVSIGQDVRVSFEVMWSTGTAGVVARHALTFPAVAHNVWWGEFVGQTVPTTGGTDITWEQTSNASGTDMTGFVGAAASPAANVNTVTRITGIFQNFTAAGSIQLTHKAEAAGTITTRRASVGFMEVLN